MTELSDLMQYMAKGGYRLHQRQTAPESPTVNDTEKALIAGHVRRTAEHGPTGGVDGSRTDSVPLDSAFPENQHSTYADDEPLGGE